LKSKSPGAPPLAPPDPAARTAPAPGSSALPRSDEPSDRAREDAAYTEPSGDCDGDDCVGEEDGDCVGDDGEDGGAYSGPSSSGCVGGKDGDDDRDDGKGDDAGDNDREDGDRDVDSEEDAEGDEGRPRCEDPGEALVEEGESAPDDRRPPPAGKSPRRGTWRGLAAARASPDRRGSATLLAAWSGPSPASFAANG